MEDVGEHITLSQRINRRRGTDEVDSILLIGSAYVVSQCLPAAENVGPIHVKDGQVKHVATVKFYVPVEDTGSGTIHVGHGTEFTLWRIRDIEWNVGIALRGIGWGLGIAIDEPASRAAEIDRPVGERAGFEVVNKDRLRPLHALGRDRDQHCEQDQKSVKACTLAALHTIDEDLV